MIYRIRRRCSCGCGSITNYGKKYISGHNRKWEGKKHTEETKRKISLANAGKKRSKEHKRKMSLAQMGNNHSDKTKKKISLALIGNTNAKGWKHTEESKRNMSINSIRCRTGGYCDAWYDKEYKDDLREGICSDCSMTTKESLEEWNRVLDLHHKDGDKQNCHPSNIDTLCCSCHAITDWELRKVVNLCQ